MKRGLQGLALGVFAFVGTALWGIWFLIGCAVIGALLIGFSEWD